MDGNGLLVVRQTVCFCIDALKLLLMFRGVFKNKTVRFNFSTASGSVLITMPESQERFRYVVMPMRI